MFLDKRHKLFLVLAGIFTTCLVVGDIIGGKLVSTHLFGFEFTTTVGMVPFPVTFLLTDVLNEFYGQRAARFITLVGFGMAVLSFAFILTSAAIPFAPLTQAADWKGVNEASFNNVFLGSMRMIVASLCAYLVSQFVDIGVFHLLKRVTSGKLLWLRATGSTAVSQLIDTVTINFVAWSGLMSTGKIINIIYSAYGLKLMIAIGLTPLIYLCHTLVQRGLGIPAILVGDAPDDAVRAEASSS
ncbi:MAG TPA: queuosine precursor transporter [Polyangiaceae bacterium]|nr:queuosine precursor transporter [Polyangiaceae bacterium]